MRCALSAMLVCLIVAGCSEGEEKRASVEGEVVEQRVEISDRDLRVAATSILLQGSALCEGQSLNCMEATDSGDNAGLSLCHDLYVFCKDYPSVHFFPRAADHDSLYSMLDRRYGPISAAENTPLDIRLHPTSRPYFFQFGRVLVADSAVEITTEFRTDTALLMGEPQQETLPAGEHIMIVHIAPQYPKGTYTLVVRREGEVVYEGEVER